YNALSHTWGTTGRMVPIIVDGKQLLITPNLSEAMTRLEEVHQRDQAFKQLWWIDMICINQDDILERGHQVAMMRTIIRTASLVVAWVGPD
ncbi:heterokaryon incompatibility, partial [Cercophora newfieldiana]